MNFKCHYYDNDIYEINESILGDIAKAGLTAISKIYRTIKPKVKKFNSINGIIDPSNVTEVPCSFVNYLGGLLGSDLIQWRKVSKTANILQKFIMSGKETYVKDLYVGVIHPNIYDEFGDVFNLSQKWVLVSIDIYYVTGGGAISLIRVSDPYIGSISTQQINPSKVDMFVKKLQNQRCFISMVGNADNWFVTKTGMRFNQFINVRKTVDDKQWKSDIDQLLRSYDLNNTSSNETSTNNIDFNSNAKQIKRTSFKLKDGTTVSYNYVISIDKNIYNLFINSNTSDDLNNKLKSEIKNVDSYGHSKIKGITFNIKNGGQVSLINDLVKNIYFLVADDKGKDILKRYNV